jgi:RNA polymerase sigma-70 factor (subfamily 1)
MGFAGEAKDNGPRCGQQSTTVNQQTTYSNFLMSESLNTQALIDQVQQGDSAALNSLCTRYQARVLTAVRIRLGKKLRQKIESCDLVQQVMLEAFREVKSFDYRTEGAFMKFLNKVVENRVRDEADRQQAGIRDVRRETSIDAPRSPGSAAPLDILDDHGGATPSQLLSRKEELTRLEAAMDRLGEESEEYRELLVAAKLEEQSYAELAEEHSATPDAIRMKVNRAMTALARIYKEMDAGK